MFDNENVDLIINEVNQSMHKISQKDYQSFLDALLTANKILVLGVGRVEISLKAWVKRLVHLGLKINYLGSETELPVTCDDLVVVASSSGESIIPKNIAIKANQLNCKVFYIGCTVNSSVDKIAQKHLILAGKTKLNLKNEFKSVQPMSTLFEQQLFLLGDVIALDIMKIKGLTEADVFKKHANLE